MQCKNKKKKFNHSLCKLVDYNHRLINNTDRTLDVVFSIFASFSVTVTLRQKPKGAPRRKH